MLLVLASLFTIQSCTKNSEPDPVIYQAAMPATPTPAVNAVVALTGSSGSPQPITLSWAGTKNDGTANQIVWQVYFGSTSHPAYVGNTAKGTNSFSVQVTAGGTYYWQVITIDANNVQSTSAVWSFEVNSNPGVPSSMSPANNAASISIAKTLTWLGSDPEGDLLKYDVYLGTTNPPAQVASGLTSPSYTPASALAYSKKYYWKIVANDPFGGTNSSLVDSFTTAPFLPDYTVFFGKALELAPSVSASKTHLVSVQIDTVAHKITLLNPLADDMIQAGWAQTYIGVHPIYITYNPATKALSSVAHQPWLDSFPDPIEQGPMYLEVTSGTIDPVAKTLKIVWTLTASTTEFNGPGNPLTAKLASSTYTMQ